MVMDVLRAATIIVSRRAFTEVDDYLSTRLTELRNHMLAGGSSFRFVTLKELGIVATGGFSSHGLFGEHGKCESCILVS
jgi:hypothetical protein